ncbi:unnamed protein product [Brassica rapa subsp. trilocularis]
MASRWWDPGDLGVGGEFSSRVGFGLVGSKVVLILRWFGLKRDKGIRERFRNHGILGDLLAILILIKKMLRSSLELLYKDSWGLLLQLNTRFDNYQLY